jgi:hypothetical protein
MEPGARFEFFIPGISRKKAETLLKMILLLVELIGLDLAGGFTMEPKADAQRREYPDGRKKAG